MRGSRPESLRPTQRQSMISPCISPTAKMPCLLVSKYGSMEILPSSLSRTRSRSNAWSVLITVAATVIALFPLASHGGPLWEAMCYAQIGGLTAATFITLLLVPLIYAICVLDLKVVKWGAAE